MWEGSLFISALVMVSIFNLFVLNTSEAQSTEHQLNITSTVQNKNITYDVLPAKVLDEMKISKLSLPNDTILEEISSNITSDFQNAKISTELRNATEYGKKAKELSVVVNLSNGTKFNGNMLIEPDAGYIPNEKDISEVLGNGVHIYNFSLTTVPSENDMDILLSYFIPYSALPTIFVKFWDQPNLSPDDTVKGIKINMKWAQRNFGFVLG